MKLEFSVPTKIFIGFAIVIASFGVVSVHSIVRLQTLGESLRFIREGVIPARDALQDLHSEFRAFEEALGRRGADDLEWVRGFLPSLRPFERIGTIRADVSRLAERAHLSTRNRATLERLAVELRRMEEGREALDGLLETGGLPAVQALVSADGGPNSDRELYDAVARAFGQRVAQGDYTVAGQLQTALRGILGGIDRRTVELGRAFKRAVTETYAEAEKDEENAILAVVVSSTVALIIGLATLLIAYLTLSPIRSLREGVRRISEGDYGRRVRVSTRDEIGQLAAEFNKMAESLIERDRILAEQRQRLLRADRLATIGKMSSQITHEIRNPLQSIGLNVEMLEEELAGLAAGAPEARDEARALIHAVTAEVDRLRDVTEQYLQFARLPRADRAPGNVVSVVRDLLRFLSEELQSRGIELTADLSPVPGLDIDVQQLRQAFLNLIRNSMEAMPDGGQLAVSTSSADGAVTVTVQDSGAGIPAEDQEKVFDPFYTTKSSGTGLGLALTQQIVSDHDGRLLVDSAPGRGTSIAVRFPLAEVREES